MDGQCKFNDGCICVNPCIAHKHREKTGKEYLECRFDNRWSLAALVCKYYEGMKPDRWAVFVKQHDCMIQLSTAEYLSEAEAKQQVQPWMINVVVRKVE